MMNMVSPQKLNDKTISNCYRTIARLNSNRLHFNDVRKDIIKGRNGIWVLKNDSICNTNSGLPRVPFGRTQRDRGSQTLKRRLVRTLFVPGRKKRGATPLPSPPPRRSHPVSAPHAHTWCPGTTGRQGEGGGGNSRRWANIQPPPRGVVGPGQDGMSGPWANSEGAKMTRSGNEQVIQAAQKFGTSNTHKKPFHGHRLINFIEKRFNLFALQSDKALFFLE